MLQPINFDVQLEYQCPSCEARHWLTQDEAKAVGYKIVCYVCGTINKVLTIDNTKLLINFFKKAPQTIIEDAYTILKTYGYKKTEIAIAQKKLLAKSSKQLVKQFLASKA